MCFTRDRIEHAVYLVLIKCENVDSLLSNKDKTIDCSCCVFAEVCIHVLQSPAFDK